MEIYRGYINPRIKPLSFRKVTLQFFHKCSKKSSTMWRDLCAKNSQSYIELADHSQLNEEDNRLVLYGWLNVAKNQLFKRSKFNPLSLAR